MVAKSGGRGSYPGSNVIPASSVIDRIETAAGSIACTTDNTAAMARRLEDRESGSHGGGKIEKNKWEKWEGYPGAL